MSHGQSQMVKAATPLHKAMEYETTTAEMPLFTAAPSTPKTFIYDGYLRTMQKTNYEGDGNSFIYLYGNLDLTIIAARRLPNMDIVSERFRRCVTTCDTIKYSSTN
ncbi:phospholipase D [Trifolium repens]|nr:phospholipase D [Trifolium repens]